MAVCVCVCGHVRTFQTQMKLAHLTLGFNFCKISAWNDKLKCNMVNQPASLHDSYIRIYNVFTISMQVWHNSIQTHTVPINFCVQSCVSLYVYFVVTLLW